MKDEGEEGAGERESGRAGERESGRKISPKWDFHLHPTPYTLLPSSFSSIGNEK
jgi:hypothetical protein